MAELRVLACDDGIVYKLGGGKTILGCIAYSCNAKMIVGGGFLPVHIDGLDGTSQLLFLSRVLSTRHGAIALFLDALTLAGFNLVSPATIFESLGLPVIVLYKRMPRLDRIIRALLLHFRNDYVIRLKILKILDNIEIIETNKGKLYSIVWGIGSDDARRLVENCQVHSRIPEPLRLAHYYSSELSRVLIPH